ncbi:MAG: hypothetical protein ACE5I3_02950, partial [Phycisphaerae bacterium]
TVNSLPTDGRTIYARLYSKIDGVWQYNSYTYTADDSGGGSFVEMLDAGVMPAGCGVGFVSIAPLTLAGLAGARVSRSHTSRRRSRNTSAAAR